MATVSTALQLALAHHQAGRLGAAEAIYRQILDVQPNHPDALHLFGLIAHQQGQHAVAADYIGRAIAVRPSVAAYHTNLGVVYRELGRIRDAMLSYQRALQLKPDSAETHNNLGVVFQDQEAFDEATACYQRALQLKPDYAEACNNLANTCKEQGKLDEAVDGCRRALELKPDHVEARNNLAGALKDMGKVDEAIASFAQVLEQQPDYARAHSNLLFTLHYRDGVTLHELAHAHAAYEQRHAVGWRSAWQPHEAVRDPHRPLRLGFVSPDLAGHPVGYFLIRAVEHLDRKQCEVACYSDRPRPDAITLRFKAAATLWRDVFGQSDDQLAEQIRTDRIDILFDLSGHTARNRLLVFARKPAPIQITWLGYVGTTGLSAMDYILADRYEIPPAAESSYCEKVLRLPDGYVCFDPPADAPPVGPLPALTAGRITLGSFNNPAKITPQVVATWAEILRRLPQSRLILKYGGLDGRGAQSRLRELFALDHVSPDRVELSGRSPPVELLDWYNRIDLALDPFPYGGGLTTVEALWMGVPVVTYPGETFAGRHSLSHLSNVGLTETIAHSRAEYVELAVKLAQDLPALAAIRARLRAQVAESPLCDGPRFAANLMHLLRGVWRDWCTA